MRTIKTGQLLIPRMSLLLVGWFDVGEKPFSSSPQRNRLKFRAARDHAMPEPTDTCMATFPVILRTLHNHEFRRSISHDTSAEVMGVGVFPKKAIFHTGFIGY